MRPKQRSDRKFEVRSISLSAIVVDPSIQQRENGTSAEQVAEYALAMRNGDEFPPLVVFSNDDTHYYLADGFHRIKANESVRHGQEICCDIRPGDREDALLFACGANADHGLPRTCTDRKKAVLCILRHTKWSAYSDREIARLCRVSHTLVGKLRRQEHLETTVTDAGRQGVTTNVVPSDRRRTVQRGGKRYEMNTTRIGGTTPSRGKKIRQLSKLDPRAWSLSTPQDREAFVREVGVHDIETIINAVQPGWALMQRSDAIKQAWNAATFWERLPFVKEYLDDIETAVLYMGGMAAWNR